MKALAIDPSGTITVIELDAARSLEQLQGAVGGYIQMLDLADELVMVINEEGKIYRLPTNDIATRLTQHYAVGLAPWDEINGPAVIAGQNRSGVLVDVGHAVTETLERLGFTVSQEG
jgi:hypothetical protein